MSACRGSVTTCGRTLAGTAETVNASHTVLLIAFGFSISLVASHRNLHAARLSAEGSPQNHFPNVKTCSGNGDRENLALHDGRVIWAIC